MAEKKSNAKPKREPAKKATEKPVEKSVERHIDKPDKEPREKPEKKKSKLTLLICFVVALIAIIAGIIVLILNLNQIDPANPKASLIYSDSFFIYDKGKYKLFNTSGRQVTDENYDNASNFVDGYAMIKKDDQYGIIRDDGVITVNLGKYGSITAKGGLYLTQDGNTKEYYLINGSGRELAKGGDLEVYSPNSYSGFASVKTDNKIKIFNYSGSLIKEFEVDDKAGDPVLSGLQDYGLFHYGDHNILLDARNGQILAEFDGPRYSFDTVSDSRKVIILENYEKDGEYKLFKDGKVYDLNETKNYVTTARDDVIGYDDYSELALLDKDYKVLRKVSTYLNLKDSDNYATENEDGNAEIYRNGEKIKEFGEDSGIAASGVLYDDLYGIEDDGKYMFYKLDGSIGIDHEYKDIYSIFDEFHHAVVADEENAYYLIDTNGNKIGEDTFRNIVTRDGGYEMKDSEGKYAIFNKKGERITDNKYDSVYYRSNAEPRNIWTGRINYNEYDVIDVENKKTIAEKVNIDSFYTNYFSTKAEDGRTKYYTYTGILFYTSES